MRRVLIGVTTVLATAAGAAAVQARERHRAGLPPASVPPEVYIFPGLTGPKSHTTVPAKSLTSWTRYAGGGGHRLAVLLTDTASNWVSLAHGLQSIGVPFTLTRDWREAVRHHVVFVYPLVSGKVLPPDGLQALAAFPRDGGTLIASDVLGGGLSEVFGFHDAVPSRTRFRVQLAPDAARHFGLDDPRESTFRLGDRARQSEALGTYGYTGVESPPVAFYDDSSAAITARTVGHGHAYALGLDLGYLLGIGYNDRDETIGRAYVNGYEPTLDVLLRFLARVYVEGEPDAVTLGTVPNGKTLSVMFTHDIDYMRAWDSALVYANLEHQAGIHATYFVQTKYVKDYNDEIFFTSSQRRYLHVFDSLGLEIASHSVAHARAFRTFPLGTGDERYPDYRPFVTGQTTAIGGTILGELRVSKFLIQSEAPRDSVITFRPGHLENPTALPEALVATGYAFSSSVTANNSLTHLPFQLTYDRRGDAEMPIFEFPITVEDEALPRMGDRLPEAIALAHTLSRYGGLFVVLIHPNITDHKLAFERGFVTAFRDSAWFGSVAEFGHWWTARDGVRCDVDHDGSRVIVHLTSARPVTGLTLNVPPGWRYTGAARKVTNVNPGHLTVSASAGDTKLTFDSR